MNTEMMFRRPRLAVLALWTAALAGCGGGGGGGADSETPTPPGFVGNVVVVGDSLADVGALGSKATIQNSADPAGFPIFPELVAQEFGITAQCSFYVYHDDSESFSTRPGCRNFAVSGSRVVNPAGRGGTAIPLHIPNQMAQAVADAGGHWGPRDLLLVDGGANDLADLAAAYIAANRGRLADYRDFLLQQLDAATVEPLLDDGPPGLADAGRLYMQALADTYFDAIRDHALDRGAQRVAMLNIPDVTLTPRVKAALAIVAANAGPAYAEAARSTAQQWAVAYNARLQERIGDDARVALVDFYTDFTDQITHAEQYGISNVTAASCPSIYTDGMGLPIYVLADCTSLGLDMRPPAGLAPGWWRSWIFADDFHLSPYGHRLLAATIHRRLVASGWL